MSTVTLDRAAGGTGPRAAGLSFTVFPTALGWVTAAAGPRGLRLLTLPEQTERRALEAAGAALDGASRDDAALGSVRDQVTEYLAGEPVTFTTPLDLEDAPSFFRAAWEACQRIHRGETRTYAWLATQAGNALAVRAAGQAMARNPIPLIIPCHRVVGSSGGLHGYGGGLAMKARLLEMEGERSPHP
ncbi:MAG: methylated-DNA--[protein]-cysteine S-methyltransferase [Dehalococcoidia bacterium]|nr:methylated-DNA--[protein]-cysteine S-methyltransferase [Dehalococcoidia bacterium]